MNGSWLRPAYRIETQRLVMRCFAPEDAPAFRALLDANDDYLRPWIPWMKHEPLSLQTTVQRVRGFRANFDLDKDFRYAVFDREERTLLGLTGLHTRAGEGALEIGYMVDRQAAGQGYAREMAAAMLRAAFEIERVQRVEFVCAEENVASQRIPAALGCRIDTGQQRRGENSEGALDNLVVWIMRADEYAACKPLPMKAFDAIGCRIL